VLGLERGGDGRFGVCADGFVGSWGSEGEEVFFGVGG